jgi:carbonic anhydrase
MWSHTKESQDKITPQNALEFLKEGNLRFINNLKTDRNLLKQVNQTSEGQFPFATIFSCIDSRTSAELIFDQGLGDIFSIRIAGNVLNEDILGSMEYACSIAKSKILVVLGHTNCGAVISACNNVEVGNLTFLLRKIKPAIESEVTIVKERNGNNVNYVNNVSINNVNQTIKQVREQSIILRNLENNGDIIMIGGLYSVETGVVKFFEE